MLVIVNEDFSRLTNISSFPSLFLFICFLQLVGVFNMTHFRFGSFGLDLSPFSSFLVFSPSFLGALFYGVCQGFIIFISIQYTMVTLFIHVFDIGSNQQGLKEEMFHEVKKWTQEFPVTSSEYSSNCGIKWKLREMKTNHQTLNTLKSWGLESMHLIALAFKAFFAGALVQKPGWLC
jgi:hypothetical protein